MAKNFIIKITSLVEVQVLQQGISQASIRLFKKMLSISFLKPWAPVKRPRNTVPESDLG